GNYLGPSREQGCSVRKGMSAIVGGDERIVDWQGRLSVRTGEVNGAGIAGDNLAGGVQSREGNTERRTCRCAAGGIHEKVGRRVLDNHLTDSVCIPFREPDIAVRPGRNTPRSAIGGWDGELIDSAIGCDAPDLIRIRLRKP